uniref:NADH dehydrogenase subunit 6 n=1 Tax=Ernothrips longitudinalis TaxID=3045428 RepID=UPI0030E16049
MFMKMVHSMIFTLIFFSFLSLIFSSHPIMLGSIVISQCILMASLITKKIVFSWFSFFIFIIYLGGVLMLFSYIISLINSTKPILNFNKSISTLVSACFFTNLLMEKKSFIEMKSNKFSKMIMSTFSESSMLMSIYLMLFLLLIMVIVVFLTEVSKGNMRKL